MIMFGLIKGESQPDTTMIVRANLESAIIAALIFGRFTHLDNRKVNWVAVVIIL